MNAAIDMLAHEHRVIMNVVNSLGAMSNDLAHGKQIEAEILRTAVRFMREFADKCHHAKEEDILFPELAKHGVPEAGCPLEALSKEHVRGRELVTDLADATESYARGERNARERVLAAIADIGHLYASHIWKEDNMVFPLVDRLFPEVDIDRLAELFDEAEETFGEAHEELEAFAHGLAQRS